MVARINTGKNISKALNYNEQKWKAGKAEILTASGFAKDKDQLSFYDKLRHFEKYTSLNEKAVTNSLHVSLNFDPSEKLSNEKLIDIADTYMEKIGFARQPYLVYRHHDAGHPHIHIVSTNIEPNGKRISMHNLGCLQSEKARKQIEIDFNLVKAESKKTNRSIDIVPVNAQKVVYGKSATKNAIANVLGLILDQYKYTSLPELNAVLKLYHVATERGKENSALYRSRGLWYRVLDEAGNKIGTPIKASAFYMKPTLTFLEKKFVTNEQLRAPLKKRLQVKIDWTLHQSSRDLQQFIHKLETEKVSVILRKGKADKIYGVTYVDHELKIVINGSDLGKGYSVAHLLEKFHPSITPMLAEKLTLPRNKVQQPTSEKSEALLSHGAIEKIAAPVPVVDYVPYALRKKKKRKRKRMKL